MIAITQPGHVLRGVFVRLFALFFAATCLFTGRARADDTSVIEFDLDQFRAHVDEVLKAGMKFKDAKKIVEKGFPKAAIAMTMAPVMQSGRTTLEGKRFMYGWHTTEPEKNITLTLFIDHDGRVVRWTVGAVYGSL